MTTRISERRRTRRRIGPWASIALHLTVMLLCAIAIHADVAKTLSSILFVLNAVAILAIAIKLVTDPYFQDDPFGPFAPLARWCGAERPDSAFGRVVAWLRERGLLD